MLTQTFTTGTNPELITDVRLGLTKPGQKELPSKYLYDSVGSALFEVISILPEYGLTRADERLLAPAFGGNRGADSLRRLWWPSWAAAAARRRAGCSKR